MSKKSSGDLVGIPRSARLAPTPVHHQIPYQGKSPTNPHDLLGDHGRSQVSMGFIWSRGVRRAVTRPPPCLEFLLSQALTKASTERCGTLGATPNSGATLQLELISSDLRPNYRDLKGAIALPCHDSLPPISENWELPHY